MGIRLKLGLPLAILTILVGLASFMLIRSQLEKLNNASLNTLVASKAAQAEQAITTSSTLAMQAAALVSRLPEVEAAYRVALAGNIDDEASPASQEARQMLRRALAPMLAGYAAAVGDKPKIHYHLPNTRSLVRLWRDKQTRKDGAWVDISDDLTSFRPTVLEVNRTGKPLSGVEVGSGGFEIRGLAPVTDAAGKHLGSVEVLHDFAPVLEGVSRGQGQDALLYMNVEHLKIATRLQDEAKHPVLGDHYVLVKGTEAGKVESLVTAEFLDRGRQDMHWTMRGSELMAAIPVKDYRGEQTGILVFALDAGQQLGIMSDTALVLGAILLALLVLPVLAAVVILSVYVLRPVRAIVAKIKDIAEDRADLSERLNDSQRDEIGALATWFNRLMGKIEDILCSVESYKNLVNAVPDPIFAVDDDYRMIVANTATEKFLRCSQDELKGGKCFDRFRTSSCQTEKCPISQAMRIGAAYQAEIIDIGTPDKPHFIQPVGDVLTDCYGKKVGYVEVARDVTALVLKERENEDAMNRLNEINEAIGSAADRMAEATDRMVGQFGDITRGASEQSARATETATAMEEMNSTVLEVARSASQAAAQAGEAKDKAQAGAAVVAKAVAAISEVRDRALDLRRNMGQLGQQAEGIGRIMGVISDIADQTNLLALNAAIEAARAGDAGRGFAVVADEVRKLAEKTMQATKEVEQAITDIQHGARSNMEVVEKAAAAVENATGLAGQSGEALKGIVALVVGANDQVQSIAAAAEEQSATSEQINRAVTDVTRIADETNRGMGDASMAVQELADLAARLQDLARG